MIKKVLEILSKANISNWVIIIILVAGIIFSKLYLGRLSILGQLNNSIDGFKNQITELQDSRLKLKIDLDKLQKENVKLKKELERLDKEYESIKMGTNMDDAISKYRNSK